MQPAMDEQTPSNILSLPLLVAKTAPSGLPAGDIPREVYFHLLEQPHEKQRKSYANENRHLLPNPLVVSPKPTPPDTKIEGGIVTVKLIFENCEELPERMRTKDVLLGQTVCPLDLDHRAAFTLKVLETSERKFRLLFHIKCTVNGTSHEEYVLSHPFMVSSNKKRPSVETPLVFDIKPRAGKFNEETEVWIKGRNFCEREIMTVTFGGRSARIEETEDNLIICKAPPLDKLSEDTSVEVVVSNFHPTKGKLLSENWPTFTYKMKLHKRQKRNPAQEAETPVKILQTETKPQPVTQMRNFPQNPWNYNLTAPILPANAIFLQSQNFPQMGAGPAMMQLPTLQVPQPIPMQQQTVPTYPAGTGQTQNLTGTSSQFTGKYDSLPTPAPAPSHMTTNSISLPPLNRYGTEQFSNDDLFKMDFIDTSFLK